MGEEAPSYYVGGTRGGYGDDKVGDNYNDKNSYGHCCFEHTGRKEINRGEFAAAATTDQFKHEGGHGSR